MTVPQFEHGALAGKSKSEENGQGEIRNVLMGDGAQSPIDGIDMRTFRHWSGANRLNSRSNRATAVIVTVNRPETLNALSGETFTERGTAFELAIACTIRPASEIASANPRSN
jgi:hypothetical protein